MPKLMTETHCSFGSLPASGSFEQRLGKAAPFPGHFFDRDFWDGDGLYRLPRRIDANAARIIVSDSGMKPRGCFDLVVPFFLARQALRGEGKHLEQPATILLRAFHDNCLLYEPDDDGKNRRTLLAKDIMRRLFSDGTSVFPVYTHDHAMLIELRMSSGTTCRGSIFNAGKGLQYHLSSRGESEAAEKWPSMLVVDDIRIDDLGLGINEIALQQVLRIRYDKTLCVTDVYSWLMCRGKPRYDMPQRLQSAQRTRNCMFETSKAYLSHRLSEKSYTAFRASMYREVAAHLEHPWAHPLLWLQLRRKAGRAEAKAKRAARGLVAPKIAPNEVVRLSARARRFRNVCHTLGWLIGSVAAGGLFAGAVMFVAQGSPFIFVSGLILAAISALLHRASTAMVRAA